MSDVVGPVSVLPEPRQEPTLPMDGHGPSPRTLELVDEEVRRLLDQCYDAAVAVLREHRTRLDRLARTLLERETLDADEAYAAAGIAAPRHQDIVTEGAR